MNGSRNHPTSHYGQEKERGINEYQARFLIVHAQGSAFNVKRDGLLWTSINTFPAFRAGYSGLASANAFFIHGECRAGAHAPITLHAFFGIDSNLKDIELIRKGLECSHRTEQSALGSSFREYRQNDHEANEQ